MPLYDFRCNKCDQISELFLKMSEDKPVICPLCNQEGLERIFNVPAVAIDTNGPKTIGELADRNTERMVSEGTLPKENLDYRENKKKKKQAQERVEKFAKMSDKQKERYIMTGEIK